MNLDAKTLQIIYHSQDIGYIINVIYKKVKYITPRSHPSFLLNVKQKKKSNLMGVIIILTILFIVYELLCIHYKLDRKIRKRFRLFKKMIKKAYN